MRRGCREEGMALAVVGPMPETTCLRVLLFQLVRVSRDLCSGAATVWVEPQSCNFFLFQSHALAFLSRWGQPAWALASS